MFDSDNPADLVANCLADRARGMGMLVDCYHNTAGECCMLLGGRRGQHFMMVRRDLVVDLNGVRVDLRQPDSLDHLLAVLYRLSQA